MARPIPYEPSWIARTSAGNGRQILRGLIVGLLLSVVISVSVWILSTSVDSKMFGNENALARFCQWLYDSKVGAGIRESIWVFPIVEGLTCLGLHCR